MSSTTQAVSTDKKLSKTMKTVFVVSGIIAALGAINWGTISIGSNIASTLITNNKARKVIYAIIGIAGLITLYSMIKWAMKSNEENYNPVYGYFGSQYYNDGTRNVDGDDEGGYSSLKGYYSAMD